MEKEAKKPVKKWKIAVLVVVLIFVLLVAVLIGGYLYLTHRDLVTNYSEAEHIERISKLVEEHYIGSDSKYATTNANGIIFDRASQTYKDVDAPFTHFNVYPLYDENDNFAYYCLVEFEPYGYMYVKIRDASKIGHGMYSRCSDRTKEAWQRYRIRENGETPPPYNGNQWVNRTNTLGMILNENIFYEVDENGEEITYKNSHFREANVDSEKRYLLSIGNEEQKIPAIKRGDKFLNLISMEEFVYNSNLSDKEYPSTGMMIVPPKAMFDL